MTCQTEKRVFGEDAGRRLQRKGNRRARGHRSGFLHKATGKSLGLISKTGREPTLPDATSRNRTLQPSKSDQSRATADDISPAVHAGERGRCLVAAPAAVAANRARIPTAGEQSII